MPLSTAESGHPTRWGFGNSRDRPCVSRSKTRCSSVFNSSCSLRTCLPSLELFSAAMPSLPLASGCGPLVRRCSFICRTPSEPQACEALDEIELWPPVRPGPHVLRFLSRNIHIAARSIPCVSSRPYSRRLPGPGWNAPDHARTLSPEPLEVAQDHG